MADADFSKVTLLLHGDGSDGSTALIDSSPLGSTLSVYGGGKISTAQSKFGGASIRTSAGGAYISSSPDGSLDFGGGDFTVELFLRPDSSSAGAVINNYGGSNAASGFVLQIDPGGAITTNLYYGSSVLTASSAGGKIIAAVWQHLAVERYGAAMTVYQGGVSIASVAVGTTAMNSVSTPTRLGMESNTGAYPLSAYFEEVRITKGLARYMGAFTPPSAPFESSYMLSGVVNDSSGAPASRAVRAYREDTGVYIGGAISDATTGAYSIPGAYDGAHTVIVYPVSGEDLPALTLNGVIPV